MVIAHSFGAGGRMDAYLVAISVPFLVIGIVGGVISYAVLPILAGRRLQDPENYLGFVGDLLIGFAVLGVVVGTVGYLISPVLLRTVAPSLPPAVVPEATAVARVSWLTVGCFFVVSYFGAVQNTERRFAWPVLTAMVPFLGMIVAAIIWSSRAGTVALAWGMLAGNIASIIILWLGVRRTLLVGQVGWSVWTEIQPILAALPLIIISTLCFTIFGTVDAFWASSLGPSNVSYLGYGQRIVIALGSFVIQGPSVVLGPYLSEYAAAGQMAEFRRTTARAIRMVLAVTVPVAVMISLLRIPIVELLLQRGAFDSRATAGTASVLLGMLIGMIAMVNVIILLRALHARRDIIGAAIIGGLGALSYFCLSGVLSKWLGLSGIVFAFVATWYLLLAVAIWRIWDKDSIRIFAPHNLRFLSQLTIAAVACGLPVWALWLVMQSPEAVIGRVNLLIRVGLVTGLGAVTFLIVSVAVFRMPEMMLLVRPVLSFGRARQNGFYARGFLRSRRSDNSGSRVSL